MDACARAGFAEPLNDMSDLSDFSKTSPQLETVDVESIPTGVEPGSGSAKMKIGADAPR